MDNFEWPDTPEWRHTVKQLQHIAATDDEELHRTLQIMVWVLYQNTPAPELTEEMNFNLPPHVINAIRKQAQKDGLHIGAMLSNTISGKLKPNGALKRKVVPLRNVHKAQKQIHPGGVPDAG